MSGDPAAAAAAADEPEEDPPHSLARSTSIAKLLCPVDSEQTASDKPLDPKKTAVLFIEYQNAFMKPGGELFAGVSAELVRPREQHPGWGGSFVENSHRLLTECRKVQGLHVIHAPITYCSAYRKAAKVRGVTFYNSSAQNLNNPTGILAVESVQKAFGRGSDGEVCDGGLFFAAMAPIDAEGIRRTNPLHPPDGPFPAVEKVVMGKRGLDSFPGTDLDEYLREYGIENLAICGFLTNCCVESTMRTGYELGYNVFTIKDCCCAESEAAHEGSARSSEEGGTFEMFSTPMTADEFIRTKLLPSVDGTPTAGFLRPSSVMHVREQILFQELQEEVTQVLFFRGLNVAFTVEFIDTQSLFAGDKFSVMLGLFLAVDVALLTLAMFGFCLYCRSRGDPKKLEQQGTSCERWTSWTGAGGATNCKSSFEQLLLLGGCIESVKTVLCLVFVLRTSSSSASSTTEAVGFDFNAVMTIVCAALETGSDTYHGRRELPCSRC